MSGRVQVIPGVAHPSFDTARRVVTVRKEAPQGRRTARDGATAALALRRDSCVDARAPAAPAKRLEGTRFCLGECRSAPAAQARRREQVVSRRPRQRQRQSQRQAGRDSRLTGRERGGEIDPGQDDLRHPRPGRGADHLRRLDRADLEPPRCPAPRHRHGVPAFLAVRGDDGSRKHRAWPRLASLVARAPRRVQPGARGLPAQARSAPHRLDAQRRRAPADRDRAGAAPQPSAPDHGRADLGADAAGGRAAVRDLAEARRRAAARSSTSRTSCTRSSRSATPRPSCAAARSSPTAIRSGRRRARWPR